MYRTILALLFINLFPYGLFATHIVGGEFQIVYKGGYYELILIQYFDHIHGDPGAEDSYIEVGIFSKRDNQRYRKVMLEKKESSFIPSSNSECNPEAYDLQTRKIVYHRYISYEDLNDPEGYYIVWERCCRNHIISNIKNPDFTGNSFYMEIPGFNISNSSPQLKDPSNDYAVVNQLFYLDFQGSDPDGDSLSYSLEVPFAGNADQVYTFVNDVPAPYKTVDWEDGYSLSNIMGGPQPLSIDSKGMLTVIPDKPGIFVFSVKVEEYRNKIKIGEVRRDFQLLVVDEDIGSKPKIAALKRGSNDYYKKGDVIHFKIDENPCLDLFITDPDTNEKIEVKAFPVNFSGNIDKILSSNTGILNGPDDVFEVSACFKNCLFEPDKLYQIDFLALDNSCSVALMDTLKVNFIIDEDYNTAPYFENVNSEVIAYNILNNSLFKLPIVGIDLDKDLLDLKIIPDGFLLEDYGMSFVETLNENGKIEGTFNFDASCGKYLINDSDILSLKFQLTEINNCNNGKSQEFQIDIKLHFKSGHAPVVYSSLDNLELSAYPGDAISFNVFGSDADNDLIRLKGIGEDFNFITYQIQFNEVFGEGLIKSTLTWEVPCNTSIINKDFILKFIVDDTGQCKQNFSDTLVVKVHIDIPNPSDFLSEPINIFTPNNDEINDVFELNNLPPDHCLNEFKEISIFNRWGKLIYTDNRRNFKWDGNGLNPGVYYYQIKYTNWNYKGTISLLY